MIIELSNGIQVEIKLINLAGGSVDYRRINDPVYTGDCVLYLQITDFAIAEEEIKAALEVELVEPKE
uniref:Uncharacterized protein n=1 Tax=viral metagenome TaxID=1070528 RepID=A0A6M3KZV5_9ZZZZ